MSLDNDQMTSPVDLDLGTSGGVPVTNELVQELAAEAERGYAFPRLIPTPEPRSYRPGYTAVIAAHPARFDNGLLQRAVMSVLKQTRQPDAVIISNDIDRNGAAVNRQDALDMVTTEWMMWCDSDDEWYPQHAQRLMETAEATGAVFVFPGYDGNDPLGHFGIPFNPATPHHTTITFAVRTELAQAVGFRPDASVKAEGVGFVCGNEDWLHIVELCQLIVARGLHAVHLAERTWYYHAGGHNSSGIAGQGDAK